MAATVSASGAGRNMDFIPFSSFGNRGENEKN
jgi:hypothetical protein